MDWGHLRGGSISAAVWLAACGSSPDLCHQALTAEQDSMISCSDAGPVPGLGVNAMAFLAGCPAELQGCDAQDEALESRILSCSIQVATDPKMCTCDSFASLGNMACLTYIYDAITCENLLDDAGFSSTCRLDGPIYFNPTWPGTWTPLPPEFSFELNQVSGPETISQSGNTLTWTNFGSPFFTDCSITATVATPAGQDAPAATYEGQSCGGWQLDCQLGCDTFFGNQASLLTTTTDGGETGYIGVHVTGTDPDGGSFELSWSMSQN